MYYYIKGEIAEITPTEVIVENNGIGYKIQISLQTYTDISLLKEVKLFIYHHVREDIELWYGFNTKEEKELFCSLIDVNGIGPNTARMMLSSLNSQELKNAILVGDVNKIKSIKGIGLKTAQRIIIDLKDKVGKLPDDHTSITTTQEPTNNNAQESISALVMLGFNKSAAEKVVKQICKESPNYSLEEIIKLSLKRL